MDIKTTVTYDLEESTARLDLLSCFFSDSFSLPAEEKAYSVVNKENPSVNLVEKSSRFKNTYRNKVEKLSNLRERLSLTNLILGGFSEHPQSVIMFTGDGPARGASAANEMSDIEFQSRFGKCILENAKDLEATQEFQEVFEEVYGPLSYGEIQSLIQGYFGEISFTDLKTVIDIYKMNTQENTISKREALDKIGRLLYPHVPEIRPTRGTTARKDYLSVYLGFGVNWHQGKDSRMKSYRKIFMTLKEKITDLNLLKNCLYELGSVKSAINPDELVETESFRFNKKERVEYSQLVEAIQDIYALFLGSKKADFERSWFSTMLYSSERYFTDT